MDFRKRLSALCHLLIVCCVVFASVAAATNLYAEYLYVDNAAPCTAGSTCDGKAWATAWKSFSSIKWGTGTGLVGPGDTLYISGGSTSKTYYETLTIGASGSNGSPITIDVGANSPSPSGHSGMVIIDGSASRQSGIYTSSKSYITINGISGSTYKLLVQNHAGNSSPPGSVDINSSSYINVNYVRVDNALTRGIFFDSVTNSRIKGCDIRTGLVSNDNQTDGIYMQRGSNNTIENNVVVLGNSAPTNHVDCLQAYLEENITIRNNWFEWTDGRGNEDSQSIMAGAIFGNVYFYNNVSIGSSEQHDQGAFFTGTTSGGTFYIWNNTFLTRHTTNGTPLKIWCSSSHSANCSYELKNNIIYTPPVAGYALFFDKLPTSSDYNLVYDGWLLSGLAYPVYHEGGSPTRYTWAQWKAAGYDTHGLNGAPDFNASNAYRLNATSPCIDRGANLSASFTTDKDGNARPSGTGWDIGAYEYGASNLALQPPTNLRVMQ